MLKASNKTGRTFCFQPDRLCMQDGGELMLIGGRQYRLSRPAAARGEEIYLPLADVERLLAPEFSYEPGEGFVKVEFEGRTEEIRSLLDMDGVPGIGMIALLCGAYGKKSCLAGGILVIALDDSQPEVCPQEVRKLKWSMEEKNVGNLYKTEWFPETGRLNSYRLYVPSGWKSQEKKSMLVWLHGAGGNEDNGFDRSHGELSYLAEKYGYLILAPNSYVHRSNYGGSIPPSGQFPEPRYVDGQGRKQYYPPEELEENALAQACVCRLFHQVAETYQVDQDRIFLMGNSMGGIGTFHLGLVLKDKLRGLIPSGALPESKLVDWKAYGDLPILYIAGTEDHNGYEKMAEDCAYIASQGVSIRMLTVGGGAHSDAWARELKEVFEFCESLA